MNNFYIKMSPLTGMVGYGGGSSGLNIVGSALKPKYLGDRAFFGGGDSYIEIDYWDIATTGNASDFGDIHFQEPWRKSEASSNITKAVIYGGDGSSGFHPQENIYHRVIGTLGNASDTGRNASRARNEHVNGSDGTRAIFCGNSNGTNADEIDKFNFSNNANAGDFGDLIHRADGMGCCVSATSRMVIGAGRRWDGGEYIQEDLEYITIANGSGNGTDFGNLNWRSFGAQAASHATRGIWWAARDHNGNGIEVIDYIEIDTAGDATDFGDQNSVGPGLCCMANETRACTAGGADSNSNMIDYVTIDTPSNTSDFGDLVTGRRMACGTSGE